MSGTGPGFSTRAHSFPGANGSYAEFIVGDRATGGGERHGKVAQIGSRLTRVHSAYHSMLSAGGEDLFFCKHRRRRVTEFIGLSAATKRVGAISLLLTGERC